MTTAREQLAALARGAVTGEALFAPLIFGAAAQIEALAPVDMAADPTRLGKGLGETRRVLGLSTTYVAVPAAAEAESLGATVDIAQWPPQVTSSPGMAALEVGAEDAIANSPRLQASLETARRMATTESQDVALIAALTGPATLVRQLVPGATGDDQEDAYDCAGGFLVALLRGFGEAGVHALLLQEAVPVPAGQEENEIWREALAPLANIARFYKIPALLGFTDGNEPDANGWPSELIVCPPAANATAFAGQAHGVCLPANPAAWQQRPADASIVITSAEVAADSPISELKQRPKSAKES